MTQAWRQPGSSFKPFIYSAALEKGFSPSSVINDEPIVISASQTGSQVWAPHNYDGKYEGPMKHADGAGQVEEHGVDPHPAEPSARITRRTSPAASASMPPSTRPT